MIFWSVFFRARKTKHRAMKTSFIVTIVYDRVQSPRKKRGFIEDYSFVHLTLFHGRFLQLWTFLRLDSSSSCTELFFRLLIDFIEKKFFFPSIMKPIQLNLPKNFLWDFSLLQLRAMPLNSHLLFNGPAFEWEIIHLPNDLIGNYRSPIAAGLRRLLHFSNLNNIQFKLWNSHWNSIDRTIEAQFGYKTFQRWWKVIKAKEFFSTKQIVLRKKSPKRDCIIKICQFNHSQLAQVELHTK